MCSAISLVSTFPPLKSARPARPNTLACRRGKTAYQRSGTGSWRRPRKTMDIDHVIAQHGAWFYLLAFVWTYFEGETIVLAAGFAAAQGLLDPILLLVASWLGSFCGDQCNFSSFALGLSAVKWDRFLRLNFLAAGLWAACFVGVGYFLGHAFRAALPEIARTVSLALLAALVLASLGVGIVHRLQRRRRQPRVPPGAKVAAD